MPGLYLLVQLCILPSWSWEGGLGGGLTFLRLRFWLPSCFIVRYGNQADAESRKK